MRHSREKHGHNNSLSSLFTRIIDTKALSGAIHVSILNYKDSSQITFSCLPRPKKRSDKCEKDAGYSLVAPIAKFLLPYS